MQDNIAEGSKVRNKCSWYQYGEKSKSNFYSLEKRNALRGTIKTLIDDGKKIATPAEMTEDNLFVASKNIPNTKTPGNDALSKELSKRHIKNQRPIPLLNVDTKITSLLQNLTFFTFYYLFKSNCV